MNLRSVLRRLVFILTKKTILAILALIVIGVPVLYLTILNSSPVAAWFDESWLYRIPVPISAHTAAENNVYITVTLDTATPITAGKMQSDCGDLRFTKENGEQLPYFINASPGCNNAATTIQVNFDSFPAGAQTIYYYYGNASAPNGFSSAAFSTEAANYTVGSLGSEAQGPGPVGFWSFDDGQGAVAQDKSSSNNDGTLSGATLPTWQPEDRCIAGKCLYFNGSSSYTSVPDSNSIRLATALTVSTWFKTTSTANMGIIRKDTASGTRYLYGLSMAQITAGKVAASYYNGTSFNLESSSTVNDGKWHLASMTISGTTMTLYVDGVSQGTMTITGTQGVPTGELDIGAHPPYVGGQSRGQFFNGFIDEPKVYPYARTAAQIKTDYNAGKGNAGAHSGAAAVLGSQTQDFLSNGLVGYWKMDEASWDGTAGEIIDYSGNGNNGKAVCYGSECTVPSTANGKFGNSGSFDGTQDGTNMGGNSSTHVFNTLSNVSVSLWAKSDACAWHTSRMFSKHYNAGASSYGIGCDQFMMSFTNQGDKYINYTAQGNGSWHFYTLTYDGKYMRAFIDGAEISGSLLSINDTIRYNSSYPALVGLQHNYSLGYSGYYDGIIDEVRVYNRALSPKEVSDLYNWAPGPVGYWDFEEGGSLGVGSTAADRSGNSNPGIWAGTGAKHTDAGKYGKGGKFNGTDDYVDKTSQLISSGNFTIEAWAKPLANGGATYGTPFVSHGNTTGGSYISLGIASNGKLQGFVDGNITTLTSDSAAALGTWYHVVLTYDSSATPKEKLFVNGVQQSSTGTASANYTADRLRIGGTPTGNSSYMFNGQIDDVKIYNYARTQKQIVSDMNGGHPNVGSPVGSAIGHWKFDEGQGTVANNSGSAGSTLNGTLTTMASPATATSGWTQSGKFGKGLNFDGSDDYVTVADNNALDLTTQGSVSAWVKLSATTDSQVIAIKSTNASTVSYGLHFRNTASNPHFNFFLDDDGGWGPDVGVDTPNTITTGTWYHLVGTWDTSGTKIYLNGQLSGSKTNTVTVITNSAPLMIGGGVTGWVSLNGQIDEVKTYNYSLTADEVKTDYNKGASIVLGTAGNNSSYAAGAANQEYCVPGDSTSCAAPVGRWDFEEGKDNTCSGGTNDVCDTSGNGLSGTLTCNGAGCSSKPSWSSGKVGKGIHYSGADQFVRVTDNNLLDLTNNLTLETWVNPSAISADQRIISKTTVNVTWNSYALHLNSDGTVKLILNPTNGAGQTEIATTNTISANTWTHIAATYNGTTAYIYFNGRLVKQQDTSVSVWNSNQDLTIGASPSSGGTTSSQFNGKIDGVRIFNYARSAAQVAWDYNRGAPVGHWKFDECQGATAHDSAGTNNGTITIGASGEDTLGTCTTSSTAWGSGATGKRNASLSFDGTDDYIQTANTTGLSATRGSASIWFKHTAQGAGNEFVFTHRGEVSGHSRIYIYIDSSNNLLGAIGDLQADDTGADITPGQWYHAVITWDSGTYYMYLNGKQIRTNSYGNFSTIASCLTIGTYNNACNGTISNYFNGQIDDVKIFNYALTAAQVKNEYNNGAVFFGPSTGSP